MRAGHIWIVLWAAAYLASFKAGSFALLSGRGLNIIDGEYYRLFTGLLVHVNFLHLAANAAGLYWTACFLRGKTGEARLLIFSAAVGILTNLIFSAFYPDSRSVGGSPVVFGLIGLIAACRVFRRDLPKLELKTACGRWVLGYAVLSNIPVFSGNASTLVIHLIAFCTAFILAAAGIRAKII